MSAAQRYTLIAILELFKSIQDVGIEEFKADPTKEQKERIAALTNRIAIEASASTDRVTEALTLLVDLLMQKQILSLEEAEHVRAVLAPPPIAPPPAPEEALKQMAEGLPPSTEARRKALAQALSQITDETPPEPE